MFQTRIVRSEPAAATWALSGLKAKREDRVVPSEEQSARLGLPLGRALQSLTAPDRPGSPLAVASQRPLGSARNVEDACSATPPESARLGLVGDVPEVHLHRLPEVATAVPSGLNATAAVRNGGRVALGHDDRSVAPPAVREGDPILIGASPS